MPEFVVACPRATRKIVVAVRAQNGAHLPVMYLNQVVATTDKAGAAHFALEMQPGAFAVTLDTSAHKDLKPPSPTITLNVGQHDDILLVDKKFEIEKKVVRVAKKETIKCLSCDPKGG
jgi:hypothetical protein